MRRLIHLALLVLIIVGVRACGGTTEAEDRLSVANRWMAEKTGLTQAMASWNANVRPRVAAVSESMSNAVYQAVSRALDNFESAADDAGLWIADRVKGATDATAGVLRAVFTPKPSSEPPVPPANAPPPPATQQPAPTQ